MTDMSGDVQAVRRETGRRRIPAGEGRTVVLRRTYNAPIEDVWDAITDPERISRWFVPVSGDLRLGGRYQLKGNAGGEILRCEPPHLLRVTWVFGENPSAADVSEAEVRLSPGAAGETVLVLDHAAVVDPALWTEFGPGATGVGWDLTLLGLDRYVRGEPIPDLEAWETSPAARPFIVHSSAAWGAALQRAGATGAEVATAVENTTKFYAPDPAAAEE
jgi:uncharacterized protein YndB with AHSA1/START domain